MLLPGFSEGYISVRARLIVAAGLAIIITPVIQNYLPQMPGSVFLLILLVVGEIIIGALIGGLAKIILATLHIAGGVISYQSGLAAATLFDPAQGTQGSVIGAFLTSLGILMIMVTNMHHVFLQGLVDSYYLFTPGNALPVGGFAEVVQKTVSGSFMLGIKIAAPQIVVGLLLYLSAGIMSRLMPQMQVFFVIMPLQITIGFFILMISLSVSMMWFMEYYGEVMGAFLTSPN